MDETFNDVLTDLGYSFVNNWCWKKGKDVTVSQHFDWLWLIDLNLQYQNNEQRPTARFSFIAKTPVDLRLQLHNLEASIMLSAALITGVNNGNA